MEISINRALTELKLLNKRIAERTENLNCVKVCVESSLKENEESELVANFSGNIQSILDLIRRRKQIKNKIVLSNAITYVNVSKKEMTIAEAIELKQSIEFKKELLKSIRHRYGTAFKIQDKNDQTLIQQAENQAASVLQVQSESDRKADEFVDFVEKYTKKRQTKLISFKDAENEMQKMQNSIDEFESEVDFILSESNTKTLIEIDD